VALGFTEDVARRLVVALEPRDRVLDVAPRSVVLVEDEELIVIGRPDLEDDARVFPSRSSVDRRNQKH
jgi:hypothetical protein